MGVELVLTIHKYNARPTAGGVESGGCDVSGKGSLATLEPVGAARLLADYKGGAGEVFLHADAIPKHPVGGVATRWIGTGEENLEAIARPFCEFSPRSYRSQHDPAFRFDLIEEKRRRIPFMLVKWHLGRGWHIPKGYEENVGIGRIQPNATNPGKVVGAADNLMEG